MRTRESEVLIEDVLCFGGVLAFGLLHFGRCYREELGSVFSGELGWLLQRYHELSGGNDQRKEGPSRSPRKSLCYPIEGRAYCTRLLYRFLGAPSFGPGR